ncbi:hypothetical protein ACN27B_08520 [Micromonospora sp. WMMD754]
MTPIACAVPGGGQTRRLHDDTNHRYQVPDMDTVLARAAALKQRRAAA